MKEKTRKNQYPGTSFDFVHILLGSFLPPGAFFCPGFFSHVVHFRGRVSTLFLLENPEQKKQQEMKIHHMAEKSGTKNTPGGKKDPNKM